MIKTQMANSAVTYFVRDAGIFVLFILGYWSFDFWGI